MLRKKQHTQLIYAQQKSGNVSLLNIAIKKKLEIFFPRLDINVCLLLS